MNRVSFQLMAKDHVPLLKKLPENFYFVVISDNRNFSMGCGPI